MPNHRDSVEVPNAGGEGVVAGGMAVAGTNGRGRVSWLPIVWGEKARWGMFWGDLDGGVCQLWSAVRGRDVSAIGCEKPEVPSRGPVEVRNPSLELIERFTRGPSPGSAAGFVASAGEAFKADSCPSDPSDAGESPTHANGSNFFGEKADWSVSLAAPVWITGPGCGGEGTAAAAVAGRTDSTIEDAFPRRPPLAARCPYRPARERPCRAGACPWLSP